MAHVKDTKVLAIFFLFGNKIICGIISVYNFNWLNLTFLISVERVLKVQSLWSNQFEACVSTFFLYTTESLFDLRIRNMRMTLTIYILIIAAWKYGILIDKVFSKNLIQLFPKLWFLLKSGKWSYILTIYKLKYL